MLSVSLDSLAPAQLALRANLRLLYLKGPALSIVVNPSRYGLLRASNLPLGLIERDADRCRQIQAPCVRLHRNRQTGLRIFP